MGILGRIQRVVKSNVNELLDKMIDPAKEIELLVTQMEEGLKQARAEVITVTAEGKRLGMRCGELEAEVVRWDRRAEQAVQAGDDGLARDALAHRLELARELETLRQARATQEAQAEELQQALKALEAKLKDVQLRKETLKVQARAAKEGGGALKGTAAFQEMDRLEAKISAMEDLADLEGSLSGKDAATEAKFARLAERAPAGASRPEVEDELQALKRKLNSGE
ncbi:MAG: PspA/IM30 family protein [Deltaproteobacteria bacterium]|nr:PspA/IM30 family protein [Deltaproteobacteria bacterium]